MSVNIGTSAATLQPFEYEFRQGAGPTTRVPFKGTYADVVAKANQYISGGYNVSFRKLNGGMAEMMASIGSDVNGVGTGDLPVDESPEKWTLTANVVEKDLLESTNSSVTGISAANKQTLREYMDDSKTDVSALTGDAATVAGLIKRGVKSVVIMQPILRAEKLVSSTYETKQSMTRVGHIIPTAKMGTLELVPSDILFNLPSDAAPNADETAGWLKMHPTIEDATDGKYRITHEYQFGFWGTILYTIA
jgi:hypothetical protein